MNEDEARAAFLATIQRRISQRNQAIAAEKIVMGIAHVTYEAYKALILAFRDAAWALAGIKPADRAYTAVDTFHIEHGRAAHHQWIATPSRLPRRA